MSLITALLACPRCHAKPLLKQQNGYACKSCKTEFPSVAAIPVLFPEPNFALEQWRQRLKRISLQYEYELRLIDEALGDHGLLTSTQKRLQLLKDAYADHRERLTQLLSPLDISSMQVNFETQLALQTQLPQRQGLTTYYANLHRDWCWGEKENAESLVQILDAVGEGAYKRILILGAGGGRLAFDIHQALRPELTIALDINPLLLIAAHSISQGEAIELYEFPIAPKDITSHAVLNTLRAPTQAHDGLHWLMGDALHPPFAPASFDLVVTPWLIDIIPEDLAAFIPRINRLLAMKGKWINFGSLSFSHENPSLCYSLEELEEMATKLGFTQLSSRQAHLPYMQSPNSRHARVEQVITTHAIKVNKCSKPITYQSLPDWIVKNNISVPLLKTFQVQSMATRIHAFMMAMIDGQRTISDMASMMEQQRLMPKEEAESAIRGFLTKMYNDKLRGQNF